MESISQGSDDEPDCLTADRHSLYTDQLSVKKKASTALRPFTHQAPYLRLRTSSVDTRRLCQALLYIWPEEGHRLLEFYQERLLRANGQYP